MLHAKLCTSQILARLGLHLLIVMSLILSALSECNLESLSKDCLDFEKNIVDNRPLSALGNR